MTKRFNWQPSEFDAGFRCEMPGSVTLFTTPDKTREFGRKPARGTAWRAGVSQWEESTRSVTRFGRDCYGETCPNAKAAMALAESIYDATVVSYKVEE